ncbi:MAG: biotin-dependent carboxyltransferase family protein [Beijerinckiaceae bacterium]|nr:biotin-dependent carboxyltransferase family protein [Beijerinckiaceae bacterium]
MGRFGFQHAGVPESGALDCVALRLANLLVGNSPGAGGLECLYIGPTLEVAADSVRLAFAGAGGEVDVMEPGGGWRAAPFGQSFTLLEGARVRCRARGCATIYMAVEGGFDIAPALGSVSTDVRSGLGGIEGRNIAAGDRLPLRQGAVSLGCERKMTCLLRAPTRLRILPGPQDDYFDAATLEAFFAAAFTMGHGANRMGARLEGPAIRPVRGFDITSDALAPGSIQISGDGQPIVLLADRQTTGGYPKIATVISADVPGLGRIPAGAPMSFVKVSPQEALAARRNMQDWIAKLDQQIAPAAPAKANELALLEANLISGVVDARMRW